MNDLPRTDRTTTNAETGPIIGLDLARHRALCVADIDQRRGVIDLAPEHRGLVLRWVDHDDRRHRIVDRILDTAGVEQSAAVEVARAVAQCVFPEPLPSSPFVAIPPAFGPRCRNAIVDGFMAAGIEISDQHLIERPIAALASWLHHRQAMGGPNPIGPMLVLDNDGGQISAAAIDGDTHRVVFTTPLSSGPDDSPDDVINRLHTVVRELDRLRSGHDLIRSDDWSAVSASISQVAVSGSMSDHPLFSELVTKVLPATAIVRDPIVQDPSEVVGTGLISLNALTGWSAGWPTLAIAVDDHRIRPAGPLSGSSVDLPLELTRGATLRFLGPSGAAVPIRFGRVLADGLSIPNDLAGSATLRLLADGRVLLLGPMGVRPLTFSVDWPLAPRSGDHDAPVDVVAIGRRPLSLVNPTSDRSHRTTAA